MATPNYRLVFSGKLRKGFKHPEVQQALAQLLKISPDQAGHLIQGERFRIKKALEKSKAERLLEKVRARGAECSIEPIGPPTRPAHRVAATAGAEAEVSAAEQQPAVTEQQPSETSAMEESLSLDLPGPTPEEDERTRPLALVETDPASGEEIVISEGERAAYRPDDDSQNVGTFFERSTVVEAPDAAAGEKRKRQIQLAAALAAVVVIAIVLMVSMLSEEPPAPVVTPAPAMPINPRLAQTNRRLEQLNRSIKVWMIQYGSGFNPAQVTLERLQQDLSIGEQDMLDGWGTALRFEPGDGRYRVISAGPDKIFGNADDLVRETAVK